LSSRPARRGAIFITATGVIVVLTGLVLVFAQSMRTEGLASANRLSAMQAEAVEQGAERWVLAQVEANPGDAITITDVPAEQLRVGTGYFWVLRPDPDSDRQYAFGITDESSKLSLNAATADQLLYLPGMTEEVADAILDWRDEDSTPGAAGAETDYYQSLRPDGYDAKDAPFETVEELRLVKGVTTEILFGSDRNRDGVIDDAESTAGNFGTAFNSSGITSRGLFPYVTVHSTEPNTSIDGQARVNVNNRNTNGLRDLLRNAFKDTPARADQILQRVRTVVLSLRGTAFPNIGPFYVASGMTPTEFDKVADLVTTRGASAALVGMVNVNTAPREVLMCLPGIEEADADAMITARASSTTTGYGWVFEALSNKAARVMGLVTGRSFQYSADIVAVSGDGRAFRRVRIVVDGRTAPAKIIYRKDLTHLGWPLPPEVRTTLRAGQSLDTMGGSALRFGGGGQR